MSEPVSKEPEKENQVGTLQNRYWGMIQEDPDQDHLVRTWAMISIARSMYQIATALKKDYYDRKDRRE
jgi:hypothetical protein